MTTIRALVAGAAAAAALAGCVPEDGFPSLAPRPGERDLSTEEPDRPAAEPPSVPALLARVVELRAEARAGDEEFARALVPAGAAVAAAGPRRSEDWVAAQQALSRLEAARVLTTRALAELDRIAIESARRPTAATDAAAIDEAIAAVEAIVAAQQARIDALRARLSGD